MKFRSDRQRKKVMSKLNPSGISNTMIDHDSTSKNNEDIVSHANKMKSMHVQSITFSRENWTPKEVKTWLKKHGKKTDLDIKESSIRARQIAPRKIIEDSYRTKYIAPGIKIIVGKLK